MPRAPPLIIRILKVYDAAVRHLDWPQSLLLLFVRLVWGWGFFQTGWGKLGNLERVTGFFTELGIPAPGFQAVVVALWKRRADSCSSSVSYPA